MILLVGLGNPTSDSENNRHNVGFKIIDSINKKFGLSKQKPKFKGLLTTGNVADQKIYAIKVWWGKKLINHLFHINSIMACNWYLQGESTRTRSCVKVW